MVSTVEPWEPESDPKTPSQETRTFSLVKIARDVLATAGANILIGSTLVNQVTHERYRVTKIMDNQQDLLVIYHCETTVPA
ncbi:MAG: hypothetical protein JWR19_2164 [Pedosphaera sp.]|nr:hypothetical protein [Pedosphaera sp.]